MTARHQIRVGRIGRDRTAIDAAPAPTVGDLLQSAREKKGVDLYRAERDTKIRARHLAALESGDYAELPGAVYTKGFLRNYALYLGLDPEELLLRWRDEQELARSQEALVVAPPPAPIAAPRGGLTISRGIFVAALLSVIVLLFLGYVGLQVVRFSQVTAVSLEGPAVRTLAANASSAPVAGTSVPGATINVIGVAGDIVRTVHADNAGRWTVDLPVAPGDNQFALIARDPSTGKDSSPMNLILTVPLPSTPTPPPLPTVAPGATAAPAAQATPPPAGGTPAPGSAVPPGNAATLGVRTPANGSRWNEPVTVTGASNAEFVRVTAVYHGKVGAAVSSEPASGGPPEPEPLRLRVVDGAYSGVLPLAQGRWAVTVDTVPTDQLAAASVTRTFDVAYNGVMVMIEARGGNAWLQIWVDDELVEAGKTYHRGDHRTVLARRTVVVNTGNEQATVLTIDGQRYGALGRSVDVGTWVIEKGEAPRALR
jgi:cytoskeletal protein RodZ